MQAWLIAFAATACTEPSPPVYLVVGASASERVEFRPRTSFAEYLVQPGRSRELRITLSSYKATCDAFVEPEANDKSVSVTVVAPASNELGPGSYAWSGHAAHGGTREQPEHAYALPTARLGHKSFFFSPGGEVRIDTLSLSQGGSVHGVMAFEFAGDAETPAVSLRGSFDAKMCRVRL